MDAAVNLPQVDESARPRLLCVDDERNILSSLRRVFRKSGYKVEVADGGQNGLDLLGRAPANVVISDMRMPEMDGAEFLKEVANRWPDTVRILLTGYSDMESTISAVNEAGIYRYINKPWNEDDLRLTVAQALEQQELKRDRERLRQLILAQNEELKSLNNSLEEKIEARTADLQKAARLLKKSYTKIRNNYRNVIEGFSQLIKIRESYSPNHSNQVAEHAQALAKQLGLAEREVEDIYFAGLLHDIGEIGMPGELVRTAHNARSAAQQQQMREHAAVGASVLVSMPFLEQTARTIRSHHEAFDGSGYPDGLVGEDIPLGARIIAVVNEYDDMLSGKSLGQPNSTAETRRWLKSGAGTRFDPMLVSSFLEILEREDENRERVVEKKIHASQLEERHTIVRDICNDRGIVLIRRGHVLTAPIIAKLTAFEADAGKPLEIFIGVPVS